MSVNWHDNPRTAWPEDMIHQKNCVKMYRIYRTCFIETCNISGSFSILFHPFPSFSILFHPFPRTLSYTELSAAIALLGLALPQPGKEGISRREHCMRPFERASGHESWYSYCYRYSQKSTYIIYNTYIYMIYEIICLLFFHGCIYIYIFIYIYMLYILPTTTHVLDF